MNVTIRDVARFFEGEVTDPDEGKRILDAIEADPKLAAAAELLSDDLAREDEPEAEVSPLVEDQMQMMRRSVLWRIEPPTEQNAQSGESVSLMPRLLDGTSVEAKLHGRIGTREFTQPITLRPAGDESGTIAVETQWPDDARPIGFVLADFDMAAGRTAWTGTTTVDVAPQLKRVTGAADTGPAETSLAAAAKTESKSRQANDSPSFWAEKQDDGRLRVRGRLPELRDREFVMAELRYTAVNGWSTIHKVVRIEREAPDSPNGEAYVSDFPWPTDASKPGAGLVVRALENEDLPLLNSSQISEILSRHDFTAVPLFPADDVYVFSLTYSDQQQAARDSRTAWFIRVAFTGKGT